MNKMLFLAIATAVVVAVGAGTGVQHVFAIGDCYDCKFNLWGDHHRDQTGGCGDNSCDNSGGGGGRDGN